MLNTTTKKSRQILTNNLLKLYEPIQSTETVFTMILDNLYGDVDFQQNIARLEDGNDKEKKKALVIKNTVEKVKVYGDPEKPLLLARDVGILMGISNIRQLVKYYNSSEKVIGLYKSTTGKETKMEFLTWKGVLRAAGNSRSTLSDLFREFLYELVAQVCKDPVMLASVTKNVITNNPELVSVAKQELNQNMNYYKALYNYEATKSRMLQETVENEIQKRLIVENEKAEKELALAVSNLKINQLEVYNKRYEHYIANILEDPVIDEAELTVLRKRFMKPVYVYAVRSGYLTELLKKADDTIRDFFAYVPNYLERISYIEAKQSIAGNANKLTAMLVGNEYCYFYLHMSGSIQTNDEFLHVHTMWVLDKRHYDTVIAELNQECEKISFKKKIIYHSCIEELEDITRQKLLYMGS